MIDIKELRKDKRPQSSTVVHALLDRLEAAEQTLQDYLRIDREKAQIAQRLEAVEKERDDVAWQLAQSEQGKRKISEECDALRAAVRHEADCVEAAMAEIKSLRAKIEAMEKQEPVWFIDERGEPKRYHKSKADYCKYGGLDLLYALPGAKGEEK